MLGIGQIGVGYWGRNLLRNFTRLPDCDVRMICDLQSGILKEIRRQYPGISTTEKYQDLLESSDIDAVVIATETPLHFELALAALQAGKHVFVEKPMAQSANQASQLKKEAQNRGLQLMVGHLLMYHPAFIYVRDLIRNGDLGDVYYIYSVRVNLGIVRQRENAFESLAPHDISIALEFLDSRPVAVSAQGQAYLQPGVEDVAFATIYFEDGKIAHLHTSWLDPHKVRKVTVVGSRRMAVIDDVEGTEKVRIYDKGVDLAPGEKTYVDYANAMTLRSGDIHIPKIDMLEPLKSECEHFIECLISGNAPRSDGQNGYEVVRILEAAANSIRQGGARVDL